VLVVSEDLECVYAFSGEIAGSSERACVHLCALVRVINGGA
jgi:hypothetical protein